MQGTISLEGIPIYGHHGYYEQERRAGNHFVVDIWIHLDLEPSGWQDELTHTVDYEQVYGIIRSVFSHPVRLLETLCLDIRQQVAALSAGISGVEVRVCKLQPPLPGRVEKSCFHLR